MSAGQSDLCDGRLSGRGGFGAVGFWQAAVALGPDALFSFFATTSIAGGAAKPSVFLKGAQ